MLLLKVGFGFVVNYLECVIKVIVYDGVNWFKCGGLFKKWCCFFELVKVVVDLVKVINNCVIVWL